MKWTGHHLVVGNSFRLGGDDLVMGMSQVTGGKPIADAEQFALGVLKDSLAMENVFALLGDDLGDQRLSRLEVVNNRTGLILFGPVNENRKAYMAPKGINSAFRGDRRFFII